MCGACTSAAVACSVPALCALQSATKEGGGSNPPPPPLEGGESNPPPCVLRCRCGSTAADSLAAAKRLCPCVRVRLHVHRQQPKQACCWPGGAIVPAPRAIGCQPRFRPWIRTSPRRSRSRGREVLAPLPAPSAAGAALHRTIKIFYKQREEKKHTDRPTDRGCRSSRPTPLRCPACCTDAGS